MLTYVVPHESPKKLPKPGFGLITVERERRSLLVIADKGRITSKFTALKDSVLLDDVWKDVYRLNASSNSCRNSSTAIGWKEKRDPKKDIFMEAMP